MSATLYLSLVVAVLGACIGSFLNVVIFRWPRGLSIREPARSFCPACHAPIAAYDNIPVLSFFLLRGRCRRCHATISSQYPLVELATTLVFLMTYDALFVARQRAGIGDLAADWPMGIAYATLGVGLIAVAVMDLEAYLVDIRVTWLVALVGVIAHTLWTPAGIAGPWAWFRPGAQQAGMVAAALLGLGLAAWVCLRRFPGVAPEDEGPVEEPSEIDSATAPLVEPPHRGWVWLILPSGLVVAYLATMVHQGPQPPPCWWASPFPAAAQRISPASPELDPGAVRLLAGLAGLFVGLALAASHPHPEEDSDIVAAIESEAPSARRNAMVELKLLTPAILLSVAAAVTLTAVPAARATLETWLQASPAGHWRPLLGLATGLAGWVIGGAIGWLARIAFTLAFGKEALGMGDVHILAATGAVAGWPVVLIGFFLAAPLALLAMIIIHLRRPSRALPYGPWLGLAFLATAIFQDRILVYLNLRWLF